MVVVTVVGLQVRRVVGVWRWWLHPFLLVWWVRFASRGPGLPWRGLSCEEGCRCLGVGVWPGGDVSFRPVVVAGWSLAVFLLSGMSVVVWLDVFVLGSVVAAVVWMLLLRCWLWLRVVLPGSAAVCGCGSLGSDGRVCGLMMFLARGWYGWLLAACTSSVGLACCFCVELAAVSPGVGCRFSWCGVGWWCRFTPFLADGLVALVAVLGGSPPILAGGFGCSSLFSVAWVWCPFCWVGV